MTVKKILFVIIRWIGRIFLVLFLFFFGLVIYNLIREVVARHKYLVEYPPPGKMIDIGNHSLHLNCMGSGTPTVIFESDLDAIGSLSWSLVQQEVAKFTRACTYDRAGFMWSETGPRPRNGEQIADELGKLLKAAGEKGPYILVGHAMGGAYIRMFAAQNPDLVCGMVLVDAVHPDQSARLGIQGKVPSRQIGPIVNFLSSIGQPARYKSPKPRTMPEEVYEVQQAFMPSSSIAFYDETIEGQVTLEQVGRVQKLGNIPLIVLLSARPSFNIEGQNLQEIWLDLQEELTLLSDNSEIRKFSESGHYIQFDQPDVVIEAIRDIVRQCTKENGSP